MGTWIVDMAWIRASEKSKSWASEADYEITGDWTGLMNGPSRARTRRESDSPGLFDGYTYTLSGDFAGEGMQKPRQARASG